MKGFVLVAAMLPTLASGAVYKCVDSDGKITFSDRACAGSAQAEQIEVKPANSGGMLGLPEDFRERKARDDVNKLQRELEQLVGDIDKELANAPCKNFSDTQVRTMVIKNQIVPGMKTSDALKAWGRPDRVNGHQYVYWWGTYDGSFFYVENGCVRSVDGAYRGSKFVR